MEKVRENFPKAHICTHRVRNGCFVLCSNLQTTVSFHLPPPKQLPIDRKWVITTGLQKASLPTIALKTDIYMSSHLFYFGRDMSVLCNNYDIIITRSSSLSRLVVITCIFSGRTASLYYLKVLVCAYTQRATC